MIHPEQFRLRIVSYALNFIGMHTLAAEQLVMGTAAAESQLGYYLEQVKGPARSPFQIEPRTHEDCWVNYINSRSNLRETLRSMVPPADWDLAMNRPHHNALFHCPAYSAALCRVWYRRRRPPLPEAGDWNGLAAYWLNEYNAGGKGTVEHFLTAVETCGVVNLYE